MALRKPTLLVVEDDIRMLRLEERILGLEGYQVKVAVDGETALEALDDELPDLVILDIGLPGIDGYEVCRRIREFSQQIAVIIVTGMGEEESKLKGFEVGADDYITKPFHATELAARVKAVLRRTASTATLGQPIFRCEDLIVDFSRHMVEVGGKEVTLTGTEYYLLSYLAQNAGYVLTTNDILRNVWGEEYKDDIALAQVTISRLRQKLGDDARNPKYIFTRSGIGYIMKKE